MERRAYRGIEKGLSDCLPVDRDDAVAEPFGPNFKCRKTLPRLHRHRRDRRMRRGSRFRVQGQEVGAGTVPSTSRTVPLEQPSPPQVVCGSHASRTSWRVVLLCRGTSAWSYPEFLHLAASCACYPDKSHQAAEIAIESFKCDNPIGNPGRCCFSAFKISLSFKG